MASPIVFTYNNPRTNLINNYFENASKSPLPGLSTLTLYGLQSPNILVNGVKLTLQIYGNTVDPKDAATSLKIENCTIIASSATNTLGTLSYVVQYQNPVPGSDPILNRGRAANTPSYVNAASGIFSNYLFGNVIFQRDLSTKNRTISIYSTE